MQDVNDQKKLEDLGRFLVELAKRLKAQDELKKVS
jgi:hypothetical protein